MPSKAVRTRLSLREREAWVQVRYECYVAGRILHFQCAQIMANMNLAYAVEMSLKQMLNDGPVLTNKERALVGSKHDLLALRDAAGRHGLLADVRVTEKLMRHANACLNYRYPQQRRRSVGQASGSFSTIRAFDDLVLQLDDAIGRQVGTTRGSIQRWASWRCDSMDGRAFFHSNWPLKHRHQAMLALLEEEYSARCATSLKPGARQIAELRAKLNDKKLWRIPGWSGTGEHSDGHPPGRDAGTFPE